VTEVRHRGVHQNEKDISTMSLQPLSDHSVTVLYENIKQQIEADRPYKYRLTMTSLVKERAEELRNEMMRRRLPHLPIDW
jgi:hypothetical protein